MKTAKKIERRAATMSAKRLERAAPQPSADDDINTDDIPELTEAQLRTAKRRDPKEWIDKRITKGFASIPLEGLRKARGETQVALAERAEMTQAEVSRLERRADLEGVRVETLRRYVQALGGELELVARFPATGHLLGLGGAARVAEEVSTPPLPTTRKRR